ncbi:DUF1853 family protein [Marinobacter hydrocarbonoclasticus]|nr:DUF1853 family protein [Marinobacter nauticus]
MPFSHPIVRDLAWLLSSRPLVTEAPYADQTFLAEFAMPLWRQLPGLTTRPGSPLLNLHPGGRLGHYYEQLWQLAFTLHPDYELLDNDVLVKEGKRVIGSADFVLFHRPSGRLEHWEVAVKFYLARGAALSDWIGPGKQDWLADKLTRLTQHQLPLFDTPQGKLLCQQRGWQIDQRRIVLQGRLYPHVGADTLPPPLSASAPVGRWYRRSELPAGHYRKLSRMDWLAGRDWRLLPRFTCPKPLTWPKHLYDVTNRQWCFVVPEAW